LNVVPDACLLSNLPETSAQEQAGLVPAWRGEPANCNSTGWQQLSLLSGSSDRAAPGYLPEQKWFRGIAERAGYVILRLRYYPAWAVTVNGVPVTGVAELGRGLMAVPVPKGNILISAEWTTTGDVVAGRWVSTIALLLVTCLFLFERSRLRAYLNLRGPNPIHPTEEQLLPKAEPKSSLSSSTRIDRRDTSSDKQTKNTNRKKTRKPS
jgi:hypothetical protein